MKGLFVHDHVFLKYKGRYYSNGKLTYSSLSYYLKFCDNLVVLGRFKEVSERPDSSFLADGQNVTVVGLAGLLSFTGILSRNKIRKHIIDLISDCDFVISRLPSENGLLVNKLARKEGKPILNEMVASPFDCLWYRGDFLAKFYAPVLSYRIKKLLKYSSHVIYVTDSYLQSIYPNSYGKSIGFSDAKVDSLNEVPRYIDRSKIVLGVIGNPALKLKGIQCLVDVMKSIDNIDVELHIVGGSLSSRLELDMKSDPRIKQFGFISDKSDMNSWLKQIDIYIQPSFTEGLPRSIIEAMALAIPCLGSNVGGIPELVHRDCLFKPGDSRHLSDLIFKLVNSREEYRKISQHSISIAKKFIGDLDCKKEHFMSDFINNEVKK